MSIKVRLAHHKSKRHYGGRDIKTTHDVVSADFIENQADGTVLVSLNEPSGFYPVGHKISVLPINVVTGYTIFREYSSSIEIMSVGCTPQQVMIWLMLNMGWSSDTTFGKVPTSNESSSIWIELTKSTDKVTGYSTFKTSI